jgi:oxygen-independent coproporphyrinogen-3 oxidase
MDRYVEAVMGESRLRAGGRPVRTLYFGGGTPSFIGIERLRAILRAIKGRFRLEPDCEITVEANPRDVTAEWAAGCREEGVNRLSIGVQGMRDEDLRFLGRAHTVADALSAVRCARAAGFDNLGIDLIVGLPGHTAETTRDLLRRAVAAFAPEHLSCYQLTVAPGTPLHRAVERGEVAMPGEEAESDVFFATHETCAELGYEGYEVSNFARAPALRSRHNSAYWNHDDYTGLGPSAHSFLDPVRSWNVDALAEYCTAMESGRLPESGREALTGHQLAAEIILMGLRTRAGFSLDRVRTACGVELTDEKGGFVTRAVSVGLLRVGRGRIVPTLRGMAVADRLAVDLAPEASDRGTAD